MEYRKVFEKDNGYGVLGKTVLLLIIIPNKSWNLTEDFSCHIVGAGPHHRMWMWEGKENSYDAFNAVPCLRGFNVDHVACQNRFPFPFLFLFLFVFWLLFFLFVWGKT